MKKNYEIPECLQMSLESDEDILLESLEDNGESEQLIGDEGEEMGH